MLSENKNKILWRPFCVPLPEFLINFKTYPTANNTVAILDILFIKAWYILKQNNQFNNIHEKPLKTREDKNICTCIWKR